MGKGANRKGSKGPELQLGVRLEPDLEKITQKGRENMGEPLFAIGPGVAQHLI